MTPPIPVPDRSPAGDHVDARALRDAIGHFATGVTVVTALDDGGAAFGTTANAVSSVSLDPPLVLICLRETSETLAALRATGSFAINVLREDQEELASRFARRSAADSWDGVDHEPGLVGAPRFAGALATIECTLHDVADGGDHRIVIGRVLAVEHPADHVAPLLFYRGGFSRLPDPAQAPPDATEPGPAAPVPAALTRGGGVTSPAARSDGDPTATVGPPSPALLADLPEVALPSGFGGMRLVPVPNDDLGATSVIALVGEPRDRADVLVYLHEGCLLGDALGHATCRRRRALHVALERLRAEGTGVVVYHRDDRTPFSGCCFAAPDAQHYETRVPDRDDGPLRILRRAVRDLGLRDARLLVPGDAPDGGDLAAATVGLDVAATVPLPVA